MRQAGQARAAGRKARSAGPQAAAAWRKARSAGPHAAAAERPRGAGNIFASCVISGSSTRKWALGGKIRTPCIPNRPIAPGNGCIGRGCCHLDLEKHAFRADVARKGAFFAHSAKKGCIRCDSCQPRARGRRNARGGHGWRCAMSAGRGRRREAGLGNRCRLCASVGRRRQRWGAAWLASWGRAVRGPDRGKRGTGERAGGGKQRWGRRMGAGCGRWHISGCSGTVAARVVVQGRGNEKETAYAASLR